MTENFDSTGCVLWLTLIVVLLGLTIDFGVGGLLINSFADKKHCSNCERRVVKNENYCPNCGTKTDSVLIYDYWDNKN